MLTAVPAVVIMSGRHLLTNHDSQKSSKNNEGKGDPGPPRFWISSGDLWFHRKGTPKHFPYSTRLVSKYWDTSNGVFTTKGRGDFSLKFFEYSNSKQFLAKPDVVEYERDEMKPMFDLILGIKPCMSQGSFLTANKR
jgi:hypothetical protein